MLFYRYLNLLNPYGITFTRFVPMLFYRYLNKNQKNLCHTWRFVPMSFYRNLNTQIFITQILVSNYILTFRHQSMQQLLKLIQSNQIVLKHSFLIITSRFLGFVTMSNHMVLKPQTQYLMSGNIPHHSASKYTAYICMTKVALRHLIILFF